MEETRSSTLSPCQPPTTGSTRGENGYEVQWLELYLIKNISSFKRDEFHTETQYDRSPLVWRLPTFMDTADCSRLCCYIRGPMF